MKDLSIKKVEVSAIDCYKSSWNLIKKNYWILFIINLVAFIVAQISFGILFGSAFCGVFICTLKALRNESLSFQDFFKGFSFFLPSLVPTALFIVPVPIVGILVPFAVLYFDNNADFSKVFLKTLVIESVLVFVMVCLHTLITFSLLLIVDKGLLGWESVLISSKAVWQNLNIVVKLFLVSFILALIGNLLFCAGTYFVLPLISASITLLYKEIFYET
jgi:hypothetical protein